MTESIASNLLRDPIIDDLEIFKVYELSHLSRKV